VEGGEKRMAEPHDYGLPTTTEKKIAHGIAQWTGSV
jgi:hypothetical protein